MTITKLTPRRDPRWECSSPQPDGCGWCGYKPFDGPHEESDCFCFLVRDAVTLRPALAAEILRQLGHGAEALLRDDELAEKVAEDCKDTSHDERWCGRCDARGDGIEEYRDALLKRMEGA